MAESSVREYAILYIGGRKLGAGSGAVGGGNVLLNAGQHKHDGPEHTGLLPLERISTTETDVTKVAQPDGVGGIEFNAFVQGVNVSDDEVPVASATEIDFGVGLVATDGGGGEVDVSLDTAYLAGLVPALVYIPVMVDNPNIVTTDGNTVYTPLTTVDGDPIMALVTV